MDYPKPIQGLYIAAQGSHAYIITTAFISTCVDHDRMNLQRRPCRRDEALDSRHLHDHADCRKMRRIVNLRAHSPVHCGSHEQPAARRVTLVRNMKVTRKFADRIRGSVKYSAPPVRPRAWWSGKIAKKGPNALSSL
jgi:hypothetical protein